MVGNQNVLQKTDAQGQTEASGGFEGDIMVNDEVTSSCTGYMAERKSWRSVET
mgnify:CR=1 FL=1